MPSSLAPLPHTTLFSPRCVPEPRPNTDPRANHPMYNTSSIPVKSNLNLYAWQSYLCDYPDPLLTQTLSNIIQFGANIGFSGSRHLTQLCSNLQSAHEHSDAVQLDISKQLASGRLLGPFPKPPLPHFRSSPLGAVTRKRSSKVRRIHNLSWPRGSSVNDGIPDSEASILYEAFSCAVRDLIQAGPGSLFIKLDLEQAFRQIPVRVEDWHLLGFQWGKAFYHEIALSFGLRSAPYIFNLFAEALHWIIARHLPAFLRHYLDDFLLIFRSSTPSHLVSASLSWALALGGQLGLSFQLNKVLGPSTEIEYLVITLDSIAMEARLPPDKLSFLLELLEEWRSISRCTLRQLQELTGYLQFTSQVIPMARAFLRALYSFSGTFSSAFSVRRLPSAVKRDLQWWRSVARTWNGIHILRSERPTLHIYTDASGTKGIGGTFQSNWFASRVPRRHRRRDIQFKELFAVQRAILTWGPLFRGHHVSFHVDNQAVCEALNGLSNRSPPVMNLLRQILELACLFDFSFSSIWLSSASNAIADAASRFQYARLFNLAPFLNRQPSSKVLQLHGSTNFANIPRPSLFTYSMA